MLTSAASEQLEHLARSIPAACRNTTRITHCSSGLKQAGSIIPYPAPSPILSGISEGSPFDTFLDNHILSFETLIAGPAQLLEMTRFSDFRERFHCPTAFRRGFRPRRGGDSAGCL